MNERQKREAREMRAQLKAVMRRVAALEKRINKISERSFNKWLAKQVVKINKK
jgi:Fe-S cluster biosynthesis and repair protein YggX